MNAGILTMTDARIHYEMLGSGPPLLLVPGGNGDAGVYTAAARTLARHFTVVTYDRRGHSRSPLTGPPGEERVERHAEDAYTLLTAIGAGPARPWSSSPAATPVTWTVPASSPRPFTGPFTSEVIDRPAPAPPLWTHDRTDP
ncbi:alpha/beta fold hydrolase [Actinomadura viridis]|uniref:alpha/beta fold hydrolase n=1 Tax=Actinomadura viridis TaxID=58110 RepID=UPI0036BA71EA